MKKIICLVLVLCNSAFAADSVSIALPGAPGSYQSDSFRADGLDCSMAIGSGTNVEFGVMGVLNNPNGTVVSTDPNTNTNKNIGVYGRIIIPIGAPKNRLDCNELYQLELRKKRMEVERLERELRELKSLKFEK